MAVVKVSGVKGYKPPEPLNNSFYDFSITDAKMSGDYRLQVTLLVTDGPEQSDGSDPNGRKIVLFLATGGWENDKDGGDYRKSRTIDFLASIGIEHDPDEELEFDTDDLIDKDFSGKTKIKPDLDGVLRVDIIIFKAAE